jgi:hypothetical protein
VNFNYFVSEAVVDFILDAVDLVARDGWRLLPQYRFDPATGMWRHRGGAPEPPLSLLDVRYDDGEMRYAAHRHREPESRLADYLAEARALMADPPAVRDGPGSPDATDGAVTPAVDDDFENLRWFWLPGEAAEALATARGAT